MLKSPFVTHTGGLSWLDAFFTSASAVCVVGLSSVPTDGFNLIGQWVIVLLMQAGGLGMMTITASIVLLLGRDFSWGGKHLLASVNEDFPINHINKLIMTIVGYSLLIELMGFTLLTIGYLHQGISPGYALHYGLFHTVSAYCNAGFSPFPDNLCSQTAYVKLIMGSLIILGGLGFYVTFDLINNLRGTTYRLNTKIVLGTTLILLAGGTLAIKGFEWMNGNTSISWLDAFFQSVTCRTAGFNTVDIPALATSTLFIMSFLMFVGASPNSAGGGIKTTTFAIVCLSLWNLFRGRERLVLFKREIDPAYQVKAFGIMLIYLTIIVTVTTVVCATLKSFHPVKEVGFEVISALTTTGLSLGYSMEAGSIGKIALIVCMIAGRVGPFTIFMFIVGRRRESSLAYPEENINLV